MAKIASREQKNIFYLYVCTFDLCDIPNSF